MGVWRRHLHWEKQRVGIIFMDMSRLANCPILALGQKSENIQKTLLEHTAVQETIQKISHTLYVCRRNIFLELLN